MVVQGMIDFCKPLTQTSTLASNHRTSRAAYSNRCIVGEELWAGVNCQLPCGRRAE
jgi:hypothetical protein